MAFTHAVPVHRLSTNAEGGGDGDTLGDVDGLKLVLVEGLADGDELGDVLVEELGDVDGDEEVELDGELDGLGEEEGEVLGLVLGDVDGDVDGLLEGEVESLVKVLRHQKIFEIENSEKNYVRSWEKLTANWIPNWRDLVNY